jgi:dienelactone hydrolase
MFNHGNNLCILFGCRDEVDGLHAPILLHLAEEDEFISKAAQAKIKAARTNKPNATVPVQGWRHVLEDCGRLPSLVRSSGDPPQQGFLAPDGEAADGRHASDHARSPIYRAAAPRCLSKKALISPKASFVSGA